MKKKTIAAASRKQQRLTPFLWFNNNAEEAVHFYLSIFEDSNIEYVTHYGDAGPGLKGTVMSITFRLEGQEFMAINGGPEYRFTEAVSFVVNCNTQGEVDEFWEKLTNGGEEGPCGWIKDKYGLSWQVVPTVLDTLLRDKDAEKAQRVMRAMLQMKKLDIQRLQAA